MSLTFMTMLRFRCLKGRGLYRGFRGFQRTEAPAPDAGENNCFSIS